MKTGRRFETVGFVMVLVLLSPACVDVSRTYGEAGGNGGASTASGGTSSSGGSSSGGDAGEGGEPSVATGGSGNASSGGVAGRGGESNGAGGLNSGGTAEGGGAAEDGGSGGGPSGRAPDPRCEQAEPDALQGSGTSVDPFLLCLPQHLELLATGEYTLDLAYQLGDDLDLAALSTPLTTAASTFEGTLDGGSHSITHLSGGLFGNVAASGVIQDLNVSGSINDSETHGFFGFDNNGTIRRVRASGVFEFGTNHAGPLVGRSQGLVEDCSASGSIEAIAPHIGGLVGRNAGTVRRSFSTVDIECTTNTCARLGGLVGTQDGGTIEQSYAIGTVYEPLDSVGVNVGGLVGTFFGGKISNCYARSPLVSGEEAGGLVGRIQTFSSEPVEAVIENSYSTSAVAGTGAEGLVGAVVGTPNYTITNSYFIDTATGSLGVALSDAEMKLEASYVGFDFDTIWKLDASVSDYPSLGFESN